MNSSRAKCVIGGVLGGVLVLSGCAEPLRTDRPAPLQPTLIVPSPSVVAESSPAPPDAAMPPTVISPEITATLTLEEPAEITATFTPEEPPVTAPLSPTLSATTVPVEPSNTAVLEDIVVPTLQTGDTEGRWRAQQQNRQVFDAPRVYASSGTQLWWYDPLNQQHVIIGNFSGQFDAQARFTLARQGGVEALEVPYQINERYGLTAISPALVERMRMAGYEDWVETYVLFSSDMTQVSP